MRWLVSCVAVCACSRSNDSPPKPHEPPPSRPVVDAATGDDRYDPQALGALTFQLSEGSPEARAHFTRGLLALHSFWYDEAKREFAAAISADRQMNMAYWGLALSHCKLLWGDDDVKGAKDALAGMPDPDRLSPREQTWVLALVALLKPTDVRTSRSQFAAAMEEVHRHFPDDESATFLALALLSTIGPDEADTRAVRTRAGELARAVYEHNPKHPGAAHYLIHAYDTPELAAQALPYARAYAAIAPAAFHARHMPAHIFSRLGMWKEAIASCQAAWDASVAAAQRDKLSPDHHDFHSLNWLIELPFELGRRGDADAAFARFSEAVRAGLGHPQRTLYATQVASYLARTGEWQRVDELLGPLAAPASGEPPPAVDRTGSAAAHCAPAPAVSQPGLLEQIAAVEARATAAAMQHSVANTKRYAAELDALRTQLRPFLASTRSADELARMRTASEHQRGVLLARATGDDRALLEALRASVGDGERSVVSESNPSGFVVHEEIADTLLRLGRAADARAEFELALRDHPGRASSLLGAARAADKVGDHGAAVGLYKRLLDQWVGADAATPGLAEARAAVVR